MKVGSVTHEDDILEAVSQRLPQYYPQTIKGVWKFVKKQFTKKCNDPEVGSIRIPWVGIMYRNYHVIRNQIKELEYIQKHKGKDVKKKLAYLRKVQKLIEDAVGDDLTIHKKKNTFFSLYLRKGMLSDRELEDFQNG